MVIQWKVRNALSVDKIAITRSYSALRFGIAFFLKLQFHRHLTDNILNRFIFFVTQSSEIINNL
jgi:hypothetical protein